MACLSLQFPQTLLLSYIPIEMYSFWCHLTKWLSGVRHRIVYLFRCICFSWLYWCNYPSSLWKAWTFAVYILFSLQCSTLRWNWLESHSVLGHPFINKINLLLHFLYWKKLETPQLCPLRATPGKTISLIMIWKMIASWRMIGQEPIYHSVLQWMA